MTPFELDYRKFELQPQIQKLFIKLNPAVEEVFETLETLDIDMTPYHSMIEPISNRNFGNTFQHQNGQNQRQHTHKKTSNNIETIVNSTSINPYPFRDTGPHTYHT